MANPTNLPNSVSSKRKRRHRVSMSEAIKKAQIATLVIVLIEVLAIGAVVALYFYDFPSGFHDLMLPDYWIIALGGITMIDFLFLWFSEMRLSSIRQHSDLDSASILGSDVQEAYNFGQMGLVITDDEDVVIWSNSLFKDRGIDLLDVNLLEWHPELKDLKDAPTEMVAHIEQDGKNYDVKYLAEARLYIFKDATEYVSIFNYSREQAVVIGIFLLDNYSDIAGNAEDDNNDVVTKVRASIFEYAKEHDVLLRRFRNDSYFAICNYKSLSAMEEDGFSILEKVRAHGKGQNIIPTLSIGFAHDFPDVTKLNEMASNAIDIAMSRGGDQAVVSRYGEDLKFFGGRTASLENTGRVQFRSVADSIIGIIKASSNVYISGHLELDMDALGSCLGMKAICDHCGVPAQIVYDPKLAEKKTRYAFESAFTRDELGKLTVTPREAEDRIRSSTLLIICDVSVPDMVLAGKKVLDRATKTIVIDHHRRGSRFIESPVLYHVDSSASSASEIVAEFIHYATANPRIELSSRYATLMLSGMFLDTTFFKSKSTGIRTFEAAEILKEFGADNALADDYLKDQYEEYLLVTKIVATNKTPYTGIVYCVSDERDIVERATLSKVANQLMQLKGINACFVIGKTQEKEVRISARSDGMTVNVQLLCEKMGGGGHFGMAACAFTDATCASIEAKLLDTLDTYLNEAKAVPQKGGN